MSNTLGQDDFLKLLLQLETRCNADPLLTQEWDEAWKAFQDDGFTDAHSKHRFREWFLLERPAGALGTPPAVSWAPDAPDKDSLWHRLLDSYYGIFQGMGEDQEGYPLLEDLWSGRQIRLLGGKASLDASAVLLGRVAVGDLDHHVPMTGATFLAAPGLAEALAKDLSKIRSKQPRSRLSQRQCEAILKSYLPTEGNGGEAPSLEQSLERILEGPTDWTPKKVLALWNQVGSQEALSILAFESDLDLEALRDCFLRSTASEETHVPSKGNTEGELDNGAILKAIEVFDHAQQCGEDLDARFTVLEKELGLDPGTSDPYQEALADKTDATQEVGLEQAPGIALLLATFLWEMEQIQKHPKRKIVETITTFLEFLQEIQQRTLDPGEIQQHQLLAYLCRAQQPQELEALWDNLKGFLHWLQEEQGANIDSGSTTYDLAHQVVTINSRIRPLGNSQESMTWVTSQVPLGAEAEDGDTVPVIGWPLDTSFQPKKGDAIRGSWGKGKFHLAAWFPKALLPQTVGSDSEQ